MRRSSGRGFLLGAVTAAALTVPAAASAAPAFTIGVLNQPASSFGTWAARGANTIVGYNDAGGTVSLSAWNSGLAQQNLYSIRLPAQALSAENADPRLLALAVPGPNFGGGFTPAIIQQDYANLKAGAPSKPVFMVMSGEDIVYHPSNDPTYQAYAKSVDWLGDTLSIVGDGQGGSWNNLLADPGALPGSLIDQLRSWSGGKPVYQFLEAASPGLSGQMLRGEMWDAIIHGASGIVYMPQSGSVDDATSASMAAEITRDDQLLTQWAPILTAPGARVSTPAPFEAASRQYGGRQYTFVLNYSPDAATYRGTDYAPNTIGIYVNGSLLETIGDVVQSGSPKPPAFVIGVWNQPSYSFWQWRLRGINTAVGYLPTPVGAPAADGNPFTSWDAELTAQGLFTIRQQARTTLSAENNDPRLLAFSQPDEPDINNISAATLRQSYSALRSGAPSKKVFLNFAGGQLYTTYPSMKSVDTADAKAADWIANDIYPVSGWNRPDWIDLTQPQPAIGAAPGGVVNTLRQWSGGKPQYQFIESSNQCFGQCFRAPTADEMRGEIWDAVIHGVRGIVYFPQVVGGGPFQFDGTPPELATEMTRQDQILSEYSSMLVGGAGALQLPAPLEGATRNWNGHTYGIVLNYSHGSASYNGLTLAPYTVVILQNGASQPVVVDGNATGTLTAARANRLLGSTRHTR